MANTCKTFCRRLHTEGMKTVRKHVSSIDIKAAWAFKSISGTMEFHGPNKFYWHNQSCCKWYMKYKGWMKYLDYIGVNIDEEKHND